MLQVITETTIWYLQLQQNLIIILFQGHVNIGTDNTSDADAQQFVKLLKTATHPWEGHTPDRSLPQASMSQSHIS